jgi:hypothetical protein
VQWELIDDDQTPDWTGIPPSLTINDVATFGGLVFGDVSLAGQFNENWVPDNILWTGINNSQTVTWTGIPVAVTIDDVATFGSLVFGDVSLAGQYINSLVPYTAQWTEINDSQTVTWTEVVQ